MCVENEHIYYGYRLVSLLEMLERYVLSFARLLQFLEAIRIRAEREPVSGPDLDNAPLSEWLESALKQTAYEAEKLGLKESRNKIQRIFNSCEWEDKEDTEYLKTGLAHDLKDLQEIIYSELRGPKFLYVPTSKQEYYETKELCGPLVPKLERARSDIEEAGKCIALGRSTASVFHFMRVMEIALHEVARTLGVTLDEQIEWQTILKRLNDAIAALPYNTREAKEKREEYAGMATHLWHVKLAWRNPTMHPKVTYTDEEALDVLRQTTAFVKYACETVLK
jgi:hypothetical protein